MAVKQQRVSQQGFFGAQREFLARLDERVQSIQRMLDLHQEKIEKNDVAREVKMLCEKLERLEMKMDKSAVALDGRLDALEKQSGNTALSVWKKIGGAAVTVLTSSAVAWIVSVLNK
jgi:hypothetical protein|nr:MAG TPA: hemolysin [Bacteriophage sp.]